MSNHEDLDEQFLDVVALDGDQARSDSITRDEQLQGIAAVSKWPEQAREELLGMKTNERDIMLLLAGLLGATPESEEPPE